MNKQPFTEFELDEAEIVRKLQDIASTAEKYFDNRLRVLCILSDINKAAEGIRQAYNLKVNTEEIEAATHPDES